MRRKAAGQKQEEPEGPIPASARRTLPAFPCRFLHAEEHSQQIPQRQAQSGGEEKEAEGKALLYQLSNPQKDFFFLHQRRNPGSRLLSAAPFSALSAEPGQIPAVQESSKGLGGAVLFTPEDRLP